MIITEPITPWSYIAACASILSIVLILLKGLIDKKREEPPWFQLGGNKRTRILVLSLSIAAALFFTFTALNPLWTKKKGQATFHLQVAFDVSESVLRAKGGWETVKKTAYEKIDSAVSSMRRDVRNKCTSGILTFRTNTNETLHQKPLNDLPDAILKLEPGMFASGDGTDIEKGLNDAASLIEKTGGQGAILLISDGNQTRGDALSESQRLSRTGIPVHVIPITSQGPAVAITDADLPRQTHTGTQTFIRGVMLNRLPIDKDADLSLSREKSFSQDETSPSQPDAVMKRVSLPTGQWAQFRWPLVFDEFGIQYVDLSLNTLDGKVPHLRRFYTFVKRAPRILSIGGDNTWMQAIPGNTAEIIPVEPNEPITRQSLLNIDAIVINAVPASLLPKTSIEAITEAVEKRGTGLMLFNGGHPGADEKDETVLMSYKDTPIEKLLPVKAGPRPFMEDPPGRQIAILIDTSGSMEGWKIVKTREIVKYIITRFMRKKDRLDLISFTTGVGRLVENCYMDEAGKAKALRLVDTIEAFGGTDPAQALELIGSKKMQECGLVFLSDGEFGFVNYRPDCRVTAFEIGSDLYSKSKSLQQFADPIPVDLYFDPKAINIPYFEPQERSKFFERGTFTVLSMEKHLPQNQRLPVPELELEGAAVSYLKEGGILNGVRPKLTDPVLAFGERGDGYVGVFASEIPTKWLQIPEARKAIEAWISHLVPFMDRNRYDFKLEDQGGIIDITISLVSQAGKIPRITNMSANISFQGKETAGIVLQPDETVPAMFHGQIRTTRESKARKATLSLREFGPDAVPRIQRIPILIPPAGTLTSSSNSEMYSFGQNRELLRQIAEAGGGMFDPPSDAPFVKPGTASSQGVPLWPYLIVLGAACYLVAIALKRIDP